MTSAPNRRGFIALGASTLVAACGVKAPPRCSATAGPGLGVGYCLVEGKKLIVTGAASLAPASALLMNDDDNTAAVIVRDAHGLYAMSAICTHLCCLLALCRDASCRGAVGNPGDCSQTTLVAVPDSGALLVCPCHGSTFAADGSVLTGPAQRPLPHVQIELSGSDLIVDLSTVVASSTRS